MKHTSTDAQIYIAISKMANVLFSPFFSLALFKSGHKIPLAIFGVFYSPFFIVTAITPLSYLFLNQPYLELLFDFTAFFF